MKPESLVCIFAVFLFNLAAGQPAVADDGSWSKSFSLEGGSIYAEEENSDIELVSELLFFDGERTRAFFRFRNNTDRKVMVKCGFPVCNTIDAEIIDGYAYIWTGKYSRGGIPALDWFSTVDIEEVADPNDEETLMLAYSKVVPVTGDNKRRNFVDPTDITEDISLSITQDGRKVKIDRVLIERSIDSGGIGLNYHYQHNLEFTARSESTVIVEYTQDLFQSDVGAGMGTTYEWNYLISTGRTWSGSIGRFCLLVPVSWRGEVSGPDAVGTFGAYRIYFKKAYEPRSHERFSLRHDEQDPSFRWYLESEAILSELTPRYTRQSGRQAPLKPDQDFIRDISASSELDQKVSVFTEAGIMDKAGFTAVAAFDGYAETAWCENVPGDGTGQYLEFTLTKPVIGLEIVNGFTRFELPDWVFESGMFDENVKDEKKGLRDYYSLNGSVSILEIQDQNGKTLFTLSLAKTRQPQLFPGIALAPGKYRAVLGGVYPGSKWKDTCIGEISFIEGSRNQGTREIGNDEFLMSSLRSVFVR
ncbi:MAG: hypothetical protein JW874_00845 [Spirochaetales bacterium]|nr:hypothetical protein [Spirochaetales bacterium]